MKSRRLNWTIGRDPSHSDFFPIFVVGHPRSGTTLLAALLDRNSNIAVAPETSFFVDLRLQSRALLRGSDAEMVDYLCKRTRVRDLNVDPSSVLDRFRRHEPTWPSLFRSLLEEYASVQGKRYAAEKTPLHLRCIAEIIKAFPNARIVWIVRDGRDAALSLRRVDWASSNVWRLSLEWKRNVMIALKSRERFSESVFSLKFEDLITNPRAELTKLHAFLEVPFEETQLDESRSAGVVPSWEQSWKGKALTAIDDSRLQVWRREATPAQVCTMNTVMGKQLTRLGYPVSKEPGCGWLMGVTRLGLHVATAVLTQPGVHYLITRSTRLWSQLGRKLQ